MKRILSILLIIFIALTGIACVSASSDFDMAVYNDNIASDINDAVPIDDLDDNDSDDYSDSTEIDNSTEPVDEDNGIVIDDSTEPVDEDNGIVIDDSTDERDIQFDKERSWDKWWCKHEYEVVAPEVDVRPTSMDSGDKILDDAVYYSAYYNAYKKAFAFNFSDPSNILRSLDAVFDLIYQNHTEAETIAIVAKLYCIAELEYYGCEPFVKELLEMNMCAIIDERFHTRYFNPWDYYAPTPHQDSDPHHPIF